MRFGVCAGPEKAAVAAAAGFDYIELSASTVLNPNIDDAAWAETRDLLNAMPIRPEAFNVFITSAKVTGPEADPALLKNYVFTLLERAALVGGKVIVFGSGGARRVPDNFSREMARVQILQFLGFCADASEKTGVIVAIEPLNLDECNIINTVAEGASYARIVHRPGVRNLADTYHMEKNGEAISTIVENADVLAHTHTADSGRLAPGTGTYDHVALFRALKDANYDARLSIECSWTDFDGQAAGALGHLKKSYAEAQ